ncbi:L-ribulose-5-phosphate 4-epimerase, partial [Listeria seeligeri]
MILGMEKIKILKRAVFQASMVLVHQGLINSNWGNVSAIDRELEIIVIKPNGVAINQMSVDDMIMTDLDGKVLGGKWGPSSD